MTKTSAKKQGQGDAQRLHSFKISKAHCFAAKIIDCYSFDFVMVHDKRLLDPSVLSPDVYVCFRTPGPLRVDFYMFRTLCHNLAIIH